MKTAFAALPLLFYATLLGQDMNHCPMMKHRDHAAGVDSRGDMAMGFSHEKTTHHFRLLKNGGVIEIDVKDPSDVLDRDRIRMHLTHIAKMFSNGDFSVPMFIHDETPPGAAVMKRLANEIAYGYEPTERGASIHIIATKAEAIRSIHAFLKFQITDHRTTDPAHLQDQ